MQAELKPAGSTEQQNGGAETQFWSVYNGIKWTVEYEASVLSKVHQRSLMGGGDPEFPRKSLISILFKSLFYKYGLEGPLVYCLACAYLESINIHRMSGSSTLVFITGGYQSRHGNKNKTKQRKAKRNRRESADSTAQQEMKQKQQQQQPQNRSTYKAQRQAG